MNPVLLGVLGDGVRALLDRMFPDPAQRAAAELELKRLEAEGTFGQRAALELAKLQAGTNTVEAGTDRFRGGWRPAIGWTCAAALALQFVVMPVATYAAALAGHHLPPAPSLDGVLWELLFGMLGLGALRTVEKVKGAA